MRASDGLELQHNTYTADRLPYGASWLDIGTAEEVLNRIGLTGKGKRRDGFKAAATNKVVIRLGFVMCAVEPHEFTDILGKAAATLPLSQNQRRAVATRLTDEIW